jgi:hypothetical protein
MVLMLVRPGGGQHEWWPKATQGWPLGLSWLRSDGSRDGKAGRLDCMSGGQKTLKLCKLHKSQSGYTRLKSTQVRWSHGSQTGKLAKDAQTEVSKMTLGAAKGPTKQAE